MADWYASTAAYAAIPAWAASTAYTVGQIIKPVTPPAGTAYAYRCTTAGTSGGTEPGAWATANNGTTTSGGAVFTNVTGQSAYGWSACAGTLHTLGAAVGSRIANGDRVFVSSDHAETAPTTATYSFGSAGYALVRIISVNRAGSVPPVAADILKGAAITVNSGNLVLDCLPNIFYQGFNFTTTVAGSGNISLGSIGNKTLVLKDCSFVFTNASASLGRITTINNAKVVFDNTTVQFSHASQYIGGNTSGTALDLTWINTPSAIAGSTFPSNLFSTNAAGSSVFVTARGVDLSALTGTLVLGNAAGWQAKFIFDSCRIASGVTRYAANGGTAAGLVEEVELVNCYDGTNVLNERYTAAGTLTTERSTTMSGGAQDDIAAYSLKLISSARADRSAFMLDSFWLDVGYTAVGSSKTATVEIISSASLNDDDISLLLEYMGASGSSLSSFVTSLPAVLTTGAALATSTVTWNNQPSTPVKQKLAVTFTPQRAGRVRGLVRLGKASTTVWVDPVIRIT